MKKSLLISVFTFVFLISSCSQTKTQTNLNSLTNSNAPSDDNQICKITKKLVFKQYNADGTPNLFTTTDYDEKGNPTKTEISDGNPDTPTSILIYENEYDENGFLIKTTVIQNDVIGWTNKYENSALGVPIKCTTITTASKDVSMYNEKGLIVEMKTFNQGTLSGITNWLYDSNDNIIQVISKTITNEIISIQECIYKEMKSYELISNTYTVNGILVSSTTYTNIYSLDASGNLSHLERTDSTGLKQISDYEYWD